MNIRIDFCMIQLRSALSQPWICRNCWVVAEQISACRVRVNKKLQDVIKCLSALLSPSLLPLASGTYRMQREIPPCEKIPEILEKNFQISQRFTPLTKYLSTCFMNRKIWTRIFTKKTEYFRLLHWAHSNLKALGKSFWGKISHSQHLLRVAWLNILCIVL